MSLKNNKIKVSIIVPVYNVEKYINRCFDSVINQTYTNIECIFVDDGSPDNCFNIIKKKIENYSGPINFKLFKHEKNKGLSATRNTGTKNSNGDYLYYLDSDDEITKDCIELLVEKALKYKNIDIVQGNNKIIPEYKNKYSNLKFKKFPEYTNNKNWIKKHCLTNPTIPIYAWNKLIKKELIINNNLKFKEGVVHEDVHFMFYLSKIIKSIAFVKNHSYIYYTNPNSIINNKNKNKKIESLLKIIDELFLNIDNFLPSQQNQFIYIQLKTITTKYNKKINKKNYLKYREIITKRLIESFKSFKLVEFFINIILLLPSKIYNNNLGYKILNKLIRNI